ncbi:MAG: hypothetical protein ACKOOF_08245 [Planctomycetaceae bacterium]
MKPHAAAYSSGHPWWRFICLIAVIVAGDVCLGHDHQDRAPFMGRPATERKHLRGDQHRRAGCPQSISPLARPTESPHEIGYYVGGGARERSRGGEHRRPQEGVWGTDYGGLLIPKHVMLGWWHGQRSQGGTGSYPTDGPRLLHRP